MPPIQLLHEFCEYDEEGNTLLFQMYGDHNFGYFCDMQQVSNYEYIDPVNGEPMTINNSTVRIIDFLEAFLDSCKRDKLCPEGFWIKPDRIQQIQTDEFYNNPNGNAPLIKIYNGNNQISTYSGNDLNQVFNYFYWTGLEEKEKLNKYVRCHHCPKGYKPVWHLIDFELNYGNPTILSSEIEATYYYKLACCPGNCGHDAPGNPGEPGLEH